jgi:hypothetical protein
MQNTDTSVIETLCGEAESPVSVASIIDGDDLHTYFGVLYSQPINNNIRTAVKSNRLLGHA